MSAAPICVHVEPPAGARSKTTCWTFESASEAFALTAIVPATGVPGLVSETVGPAESTSTTCGDVYVASLPTRSEIR